MNQTHLLCHFAVSIVVVGMMLPSFARTESWSSFSSLIEQSEYITQ